MKTKKTLYLSEALSAAKADLKEWREMHTVADYHLHESRRKHMAAEHDNRILRRLNLTLIAILAVALIHFALGAFQ